MKEKAISPNRQLFLNMTSSIVAFGTGLLISFFLSPYIVKTLGVEANGFITLANNFVGYAALSTVALNSMAGRFISIEVHRNNMERANKYFTTVIMADLIIAAVLFVPSVFCVYNLEHLIHIPARLVTDVKLLFSLVLLNFLIGAVFSCWSTATFVMNRLELQSLRSMQGSVIRAVVVLALFTLFQPSVYFVGVATLAMNLFSILFSIYYKFRLLPELHFKKKDFDLPVLWEVLSSGIWNTVLRTGQILLSGLDLLITNVFIGPVEMGILALAKTVPNVLIQLAGTLSSVFAPSLTICYAKEDLQGIKKELKRGMKLTGIILTVPLADVLVFGKEFYRLWVPSQDAQLLQVLTVLTCFGLIFTSGMQCLYNIFTVVNRLRTYSLLMLASGALSTAMVFLLLKTTDLGILAVAGVSSVVNLIRNLVYVVPWSAKYLKLKWDTFFPEVGYTLLSVVILTFIGLGVKQVFAADSWLTLILAGGTASLLGLAANILILLNKEERAVLRNVIMRRFGK